jgi:RNA polymerase sigma factor (sigma-70 family)
MDFLSGSRFGGRYSQNMILGDSDLLRRYAQDSSQEAFAEIVRRHIDFVYAAALRQAGSAARAEDVTQAVFTDLARKARTLTGRRELVGWLHTSAHYAATMIRRSEARRQLREQKAQTMQEILHTPDSGIDWETLRPLLDDALLALGERDREAVLLRFFKQRSFGEIGATLGLSEEAARKRVERGVEKLRGLLAKRGLTSTAAALELAMAGQAAVAAPAGLAATVTGGAIAAGAAGPLVVFFAQIVGAGKVAAGIAALVALIAAVNFAVRETHAARAAEQILATERQSAVTLQSRRDQLEKRLVAARRDRAALEKTVADQKAKIAQALAQLGDSASERPDLETITALANSDEMRGMIAEIQHRFCHYWYDALFKSLRLSPEAIARFEEIYTTSATQQPKIEIQTKGDGHGNIEISLGGNSELDADAIRQLLGEEGFRQYQAYEPTIALRLAVVDKLAGNLIYTDSPLNAGQAQQLIRILADATPDPKTPDPTEIDWLKVLAQTRGFLSATQWAALARLSGTLSTTWNVDSF